uniref:Uncharacterized protein n=1 Tax=Chelonoidis abingdonii TaxID=106734 RepID=A0A8C0GQV9_CHEAB
MEWVEKIRNAIARKSPKCSCHNLSVYTSFANTVYSGILLCNLGQTLRMLGNMICMCKLLKGDPVNGRELNLWQVVLSCLLLLTTENIGSFLQYAFL